MKIHNVVSIFLLSMIYYRSEEIIHLAQHQKNIFSDDFLLVKQIKRVCDEAQSTNILKVWIILNGWGLRLLSVVVEMLEILLYCIDWLVSFIDPLIMLRWIYVRWESVREVSRNVIRCMLSEEALQKFLNEIPAEDRHETRPVVNLDQNSFEGLILTH